MNEMISSAVLSYSPGLFFLKNTKREYVFCNQNFSEFLDLPNHLAICGKTDAQLIWSQFNHAHFVKEDLSVLSEQIISFKQYRVPAYQGEMVWINVTKQPWHHPDKQFSGIIGIVDIIQDQKAQERRDLQLMMCREIERISNKINFTLSHHVKVPLSAIKVYAEILEKGLIDLGQKFCPQKLKMLVSIPEKINRITHKAVMALEWSLFCSGDNGRKTLEEVNALESIQEILSLEAFSEGEREFIIVQRLYDLVFLGNKNLFQRVLFALIKENIAMLSGKPHAQIILRLEKINQKECLKILNTGETIEACRRPYLFEYEDRDLANNILFLCQSILQGFQCDISYEVTTQGENCFILSFPEIAYV